MDYANLDLRFGFFIIPDQFLENSRTSTPSQGAFL